MLPIESVANDLCAKISANDCILVAPPGAGKSTFLPLRLLKLAQFAQQKIIMLQPRQVAAKTIARYLASQLGERVGNTVGYQVRGDSQFSSSTGLLIMTEGMLSAKLQSDPELAGVGLIIFDEFHERSIYSDIAFGLAIEVQQGLRDDLRLLVMSATLQIEGVKQLLPNADVITCEGRSFPIEYYYRPNKLINKQAGASFALKQALIANVLGVIQEALQQHKGNILVFLAGAADIFAVQQALLRLNIDKLIIAPLLGALSLEQQQLAINIPSLGMRKVVLATNIAETSLTIDGVSVVIDTGREKVQKFNLSRGGNTLVEQHISKASSIQRSGRAGRQQAGVCYRLWDEQTQQRLLEASRPQILEQDISRELLMLLEWGSSFEQLPLIDRPSKAQVDSAYDLLKTLGLLRGDSILNSLGKAAAKFNTHPRLATLLLLATSTHKQDAYLIALLVTILEAKPLFKEVDNINIESHIQYLINNKHHPMHQDVKRWCKQLNITAQANKKTVDSVILQDILLLCFNDNIGMHKGSGRYILSKGSGVAFHAKDEQQYSHIQWLCCLEITINKQADAQIRLFCQLDNNVIEQYINTHQQNKELVVWDRTKQKVSAKRITSLGEINLSEQAIEAASNMQTKSLLVEYLCTQGVAAFSSKAVELMSRMSVAASISKELDLPSTSFGNMFDDWEHWLSPYLDNILSAKQLMKLDWVTILLSRLTWDQQQTLKKQFPTHFTAPTGNKHKLHYDHNHGVSLAIRLQELYGVNEAITVGRDKIPITLSLLSPAHREIQKTKDIVGFWQGSYKDVQKEMKGRYPKHFWPDDPAHAKATTKTKNKM